MWNRTPDALSDRKEELAGPEGDWSVGVVRNCLLWDFIEMKLKNCTEKRN